MSSLDNGCRAVAGRCITIDTFWDADRVDLTMVGELARIVGVVRKRVFRRVIM